MIQISTILHESKAYSYHHFLNWVRRQDYKDSEAYVPVHMGKYGEANAVKIRREMCRQRAIDTNAEALMFVDCDVVPPSDAIYELLQVPEADIVTGIYFARQNGAEARAVCWKRDDNRQTFINAEEISEVSGAGMGCCLIKRPVLERCDFKFELPDDDYPYWDDARRKGFRLRSLNTLRCHHYQSEGASIYHPFGVVEFQDLEEYEVLCPDGVNINSVPYPQGIVHAPPEIMEEVKRLDAPYREGYLKVRTRKVEDVSRNVVPGNLVGHTEPPVAKPPAIRRALGRRSRLPRVVSAQAKDDN